MIHILRQKCDVFGMNLFSSYLSKHWVQKLKLTDCSFTWRVRGWRRYSTKFKEENLDSDGGTDYQMRMQTIKIPTRMTQIQEYFDVERDIAEEILELAPYLNNIRLYNLMLNIDTLKSYQVDRQEVRNYLHLLCVPPNILEHRMAIIHELGMETLPVSLIANFSVFFNQHVSVLQCRNILPKDYDPYNVLLALGMPASVYNNLKFPEAINMLSLCEVHRSLVLYYLSWYLQLEESYVEEYLQRNKLKRYSLKLQILLFKKLTENWNLTHDKVLKHSYLLKISLSNLNFIEKNVKHLFGSDIKKIFLGYPRALRVPCDKLWEISHLFKNSGLREGLLLTKTSVLLYRPDTLNNRIKEMQHDLYFSEYFCHHRAVEMIIKKCSIEKRLYFLKANNMGVPTLNVLMSCSVVFSKYVQRNIMKSNNRELMHYLAVYFKLSLRDTYKKVVLPSKYYYISFISMSHNITCLNERGFTEKQILTTPEILFYPPKLVAKHLQCLQKRVGTVEMTKYPYSLQIMLYFIHKDLPYVY